MPKPGTKQALLEVIAVERSKLNNELRNLTDAQMEIPGACERWSVKDIMSHLVDWEQRCLGWYLAGLRGEVPKTPDENYNWRQLSDLNQEIYLKYKDFNLPEVRERFKASFDEMMSVIAGLSEEELFTPNYYEWTGKGLLKDYFDANTASHYRWASNLIRKFKKNISKQERI